MNKNLTLSFNHKAEYTQQAVLVNGEPILSPKNTPTLEKFAKTSLILLKIMDSGFTVEKLAIALANTNEDGVELAISAITCGDILTEISPEYQARGAMLLMAHLLGNQPISELVEETQTIGISKYLNMESINHNEMYTLSTLVSLIVFGMIMAADTKMFHSK
jgi:hypothetical protein